MKIDWQAFRRARVARDVRFDGKFFVGAHSTRIYCRPSCPVPTIPDKNVRYLPTAAAAAEAGFRPCLRCSPECSPGTPAWLGTSNTVSRALRLIDESGLEDGGIEALAGRLGVGARHLRRLFLQHLGATPSAVARTRRLHFAKKLIDETRLAMNQVALASGFGSVRRFNAGIRDVYKRTPKKIRQLARQKSIEPENYYLFRLRFRPPYHWQSMLTFLEARATPGVEAVDSGIYRRSIAVNGNHGYFEISLDKSTHTLVARIQFGDPRALFFIVERIRAMFDVNADWSTIASALRADGALARRIDAAPGMRVPGCWNGFELAVRAVLRQQITVKGAAALAGRLARSFGYSFSTPAGLTHIFPGPEVLADANLASIGLPKARAGTIRAIARAVCDRTISLEGIVDVDAFVSGLQQIPGIVEWTAQYIAMSALRA